METVLILARQIAIMFVFMAIGWILFKTGLLSIQGTRDLSNLLLMVVIPVIIVKSFIVIRTPENTSGFFISFALSLGAIVLSAVIARLVFGKHSVVDQFGTAFSNAGFFGIPIVQAFLGDTGVFYIASFVMMTFVFQWTYGVHLFTKEKTRFKAKKLLANPVLIAFTLALILFFTQVPVPGFLTVPLGMITPLNTPIAMLVLGSYLARGRFRDLFTTKNAYIAVAIRLILIPLLTLALFTLLPRDWNMIRLAVLIPAIAPVGVNVTLFAGLHDQDYGEAVRIVCLSTLLCIATIPFIVLFAQWAWV
ncbi:MAG: AEC family transporter [bacterium]